MYAKQDEQAASEHPAIEALWLSRARGEWGWQQWWRRLLCHFQKNSSVWGFGVPLRDPLGAGDHHHLLWKPVMRHIWDLAGRREGLDSTTSAPGLSFLHLPSASPTLTLPGSHAMGTAA